MSADVLRHLGDEAEGAPERLSVGRSLITVPIDGRQAGTPDITLDELAVLLGQGPNDLR